MLKEIYIDNFRRFINQRIEFSETMLIRGKNGTGKTTLMEFIYRLKRFIRGGSNTPPLRGGSIPSQGWRGADPQYKMRKVRRTFSSRSKILRRSAAEFFIVNNDNTGHIRELFTPEDVPR